MYLKVASNFLFPIFFEIGLNLLVIQNKYDKEATIIITKLIPAMKANISQHMSVSSTIINIICKIRIMYNASIARRTIIF